MKFQNPPPSGRALIIFAKKRDDDENAVSPPARARSHRVSRAVSRAMNARFCRDGVKNTPARASPPPRPTRDFPRNPPFCRCRENVRLQKNEKIHSFSRFLRRFGKRSRSRSRDRKRVLGAGANGWGRTLEVSFAEATVDVKENIFDCVRVFVDVFCA